MGFLTEQHQESERIHMLVAPENSISVFLMFRLSKPHFIFVMFSYHFGMMTNNEIPDLSNVIRHCWWFQPSETYESAHGIISPNNYLEKKHVPNHQPSIHKLVGGLKHHKKD